MLALLLLAAPPGFAVAKSDTHLTFATGDHVLARYQYAGDVQEEKSDKRKPLAKPFFYPLATPGGAAVTREWPMKRGTPDETKDHFHQKSVWFCHGDVEPGWYKPTTKSADGRPGAVNFWTEAAGHGRIVCKEVGPMQVAGPGVVAVATLNEWQAADGTPILTEGRTITVRAFPEGVQIGLAIDLSAAFGPVTFGDTKEGAMGVRVHDAMRLEKTSGTVTSSDGTSVAAPAKDDLKVWGKGADWHDYSGTVGGKACGLAVFDHPQNQPRSAWHTRAYGLMAANPFGRSKSKFPLFAGRDDLVKLERGQTLRLRYAVYAHDGDVNAGKVAAVFQEFAVPER